MFSEKRDFGMIGKIFGVPRRWMTRIASFCSSLTVSHPILTIKKPDFPDPTKNPVEIGIDEEVLKAFIEANGGSGNQNDGSVEKPTSTTSLSATYPGTDAAATNTWTAGGEKGLVETVMTRTRWSGTYLYGYYRTKTYDRLGRLYSVSAETRYIIDTPVAYTGN